MDWLASCPTRHVCMVVHGCAAHTTYHDRGAHEGAEMCVLSAFWRDSVARRHPYLEAIPDH